MMAEQNRTPEQRARDTIDAKLGRAGWKVQSKHEIDFNAGPGIAVREYQTDAGPADYVLFIDRQPVGVIEAKPEAWGQKITTVEEQSTGYAEADLKWLKAPSRPVVYESTGALTRFTYRRDPKPRSREVFSFHRPETMQIDAKAREIDATPQDDEPTARAMDKAREREQAVTHSAYRKKRRRQAARQRDGR